MSPGDGGGQQLLREGKASQEAGKFLLWQSGDHLRAGIALLTEIADAYPRSVLSDYINLAIGRNLSRPFRDYDIGKLREADPDAALRKLEKVNADRLPPYLQVDAHVATSNALAVKGDRAAATRALERARRIVKERPALQLLLEQAQLDR